MHYKKKAVKSEHLLKFIIIIDYIATQHPTHFKTQTGSAAFLKLNNLGSVEHLSKQSQSNPLIAELSFFRASCSQSHGYTFLPRSTSVMPQIHMWLICTTLDLRMRHLLLIICPRPKGYQSRNVTSNLKSEGLQSSRHQFPFSELSVLPSSVLRHVTQTVNQ